MCGVQLIKNDEPVDKQLSEYVSVFARGLIAGGFGFVCSGEMQVNEMSRASWKREGRIWKVIWLSRGKSLSCNGALR